jgi:hypothetical protein
MRLTDVAFDLFDREFDGFLNLRALSAQPGNTSFNDFFFPGPFTNLLFVSVRTRWKILEGRQDALQIEIHILVGILDQLFQSDPK